MQPGPIGSQPSFFVDRKSPVPECIDDVIKSFADYSVRCFSLTSSRFPSSTDMTSCIRRTSIRWSASILSLKAPASATGSIATWVYQMPPTRSPDQTPPPVPRRTTCGARSKVAAKIRIGPPQACLANKRVNGRKILRNLIPSALAIPMHHVGRRPRNLHGVFRQPKMPR